MVIETQIDLPHIIEGDEGSSAGLESTFSRLKTNWGLSRDLPPIPTPGLSPKIAPALSLLLTHFANPNYKTLVNDLTLRVDHVDASYKLLLRLDPNKLHQRWTETSLALIARHPVIAALGFDISCPDYSSYNHWDQNTPTYLIVKGCKAAQFYPSGQTVGPEYNQLLGWKWRPYMFHLIEQLGLFLSTKPNFNFQGVLVDPSNEFEAGDTKNPVKVYAGNKSPLTNTQKLIEGNPNYQRLFYSNGQTLNYEFYYCPTSLITPNTQVQNYYAAIV